MKFTVFEIALIERLRVLPVDQRLAALEDARAENSVRGDRFPALLIAAEENEPTSIGEDSETCAVQALSAALAAAPEDQAGARVGHYKLLQQIGEGGFGVVWMAEQQQPIRRRVALKIIKSGMDTHEVISRFEAERQALALMEHPNIAHVFDAGTTPLGRPYFAMELVRGLPITHYCDENRLSAEARLRLFITVCQAVQHAHQKGVIHRDLKPSNILVTLHDGMPMPKIIDFGIAKAISGRLTDKTLFTQFHSFIGTPAYTSPEQMEMSGLDVDTRSDIYSLGVLLYELLTGRPPFDADTLAKSGLEAMRRTILETDPPRPSAHLATLPHADRTSRAHERGTDPVKLSLLLRGDLDWIAMRCLEKDRTRRYDSVASLAADIERHLSDGVVEARPPSRLYQTKKFIRRHKVGFVATIAVALSLIVGLVAATVALVRERAARAEAVTARQAEGMLRQQAEIARAAEVKRAARTSLELANRHLADGRVADGLAYLVYAARKDPLNPILAPRLASVLSSHNFILPESAPFECGSRIVGVRYALDGQTFLVGTEDGTMRVFASATGKMLREFRAGKLACWITGSIFAPQDDEIYAARFMDGTLAAFDATTGRQHGTSVYLDPAVNPSPDATGLSPDGRWLFAYAPGTAKFWLWDARTGEERLALSLKGREYSGFDFSADGRQLSITEGEHVRLWSLPECVPFPQPIVVERAPTRGDARIFARFAPDSRHLVVLDPHTGFQLYGVATGARLGPRSEVEAGSLLKRWEFSPDGRLLYVGEKASELRDLTNGQRTLLPFSSRDGYAFDRSFSRDGSLLLVTSTRETPASLWDTRTGQTTAEFTLSLPANLRGALSPDGTQIVVGTAEGAIHRLRVGRGVARPLVLARPKLPLPVAFLPTAPTRLLSFSADRAHVLDVASGREVTGGFTLPRPLTEAAPERGGKSPLRSDLKFFVVRNGPGWEAWQLSTAGGVKVVPLQGSPPSNGIVTFSPAADVVAINDYLKIRVWDLRTGIPLGPPIDPGWPLWPQSVNFSPDGRRLAAAYVLEAPVIWDVATSEPATATFQAHPDRTFSTVQFSPDGTQVVTADLRGEARVWDAASGAPLSPLLPTADMLVSAHFSPDGRYFVTRSSAEARIWDLQTGALVGEPIGPLGNGQTLRFSSDGRRFTTESQDGRARVFDVRTAHVFAEPTDHGAIRTSAGHFSPDGLFLRTETASDVRLWSVPPALPDGTPPPEWLLELATVCAGKVVNDQGQLTAAVDVSSRIATLRQHIEDLPPDAPLADWGRWILNDRADRSIAPGFTLSPHEANQLAASLP